MYEKITYNYSRHDVMIAQINMFFLTYDGDDMGGVVGYDSVCCGAHNFNMPAFEVGRSNSSKLGGTYPASTDFSGPHIIITENSPT